MRSSSEVVTAWGRQGKQDKIDRYGWTVKDAPGKYMMIDKAELNIDLAYQRERRSVTKIRAIASAWSWPACGALVACERGGKYWVIDGGHRKLAADMRSDIRALPCLIFELNEDVRREATAFLDINTQRTSPKEIDKINARLTQGDVTIADLVDLLESTGHHFDRTPGKHGVAFVRLLERCYLEDADITKRLWPVCVSIHASEAIHGDIWAGLFTLEKKGHGIGGDRAAKLKKAGKTAILQEVQKFKAVRPSGHSTMLSCAQGVAAVLNFKARNRIDV